MGMEVWGDYGTKIFFVNVLCTPKVPSNHLVQSSSSTIMNIVKHRTDLSFCFYFDDAVAFAKLILIKYARPKELKCIEFEVCIQNRTVGEWESI